MIVTADRVHAEFYHVKKRVVTKGTALENKHWGVDDVREYMTQAGGVLAGGFDEGIKDRAKATFFGEIADAVRSQLLDGEDIILVVADAYKNELRDALHVNLRARVSHVVPKDLMKETVVALFEHIERDLGWV